MKPITSTLTLSLIRCHWLFHRISIPKLQNPNPEIPGLGSNPGIANTIVTRTTYKSSLFRVDLKLRCKSEKGRVIDGDNGGDESVGPT